MQLGNALTMEVITDWKSLRIFIFMNLKRPLNSLKNKIPDLELKNMSYCNSLTDIASVLEKSIEKHNAAH